MHVWIDKLDKVYIIFFHNIVYLFVLLLWMGENHFYIHDVFMLWFVVKANVFYP